MVQPSENEQKVSVIMLNHNGLTFLGEKLDRCISAVLNSDYQNYEFILVDNKSTDGTLEYLERKYAPAGKMRILRLDKNYGSAGGCNRGAYESSNDSKYLIFLHNDIEVPRDWLRKMVSSMESSDNSTIGVISAVYDVKRALTCGKVYVEYPSLYAIDFPADNSVLEINHFSTGCGIVRRDAFLSLGGFEEKLFSWYDEVDFAWKAKLIGGKIIFEPGAVATHHGAHIHLKLFDILRNIEFAETNRVKLCLMYLERKSLLALLIYEIYRLIIAPAKFRNVEAYRVIAALKSLIRSLCPNTFRYIITNRKRFQKYRRTSDRQFFEPWYLATQRGVAISPRTSRLARLLYKVFCYRRRG